MRRLLFLSVVVALLASAALFPTNAVAQGVNPARLVAAGWDCILPPPFNPNVHCAPPGSLEAILSADAEMVVWLAFATDDLGATDAPLLGSERMIRADLFNGQPVPDRPAELRVQLALPAVRLGLLHLPHVRQPLVGRVVHRNPAAAAAGPACAVPAAVRSDGRAVTRAGASRSAGRAG